MAYSMIITGLCFLFLPNIALWDFIPDCVGYFLLMQGISRASLLAPVMQQSRRAFQKLFYITLFRLITAIVIGILFSSATSTQGDGYQTLFTVVFCGFETVYGFAAFRTFFDGIDYLQLRHSQPNYEKERTDVKTLTFAFLASKAIFNIFPTLGALFGASYSSDVETLPGFDISYYTTILSFCNLLIVSALGIFWLVLLLRFLRLLKKDTALTDSIDVSYYDLISEQPTLLLRHRLRAAFTLLSIAFFFLLDLSMDRFNILPDPIAAILIFCAFVLLVNQKLLPKKIYALCAVGIALSLGAEITQNIFAKNYGDVVLYYGLDDTTSSLVLYLTSGMLQILWQVSLLFTVWQLYRIICEVIQAHTGTVSDDKTQPSQIQKDLQKRIRIALVLFIIYALSSCVHAFLFPFLELYWLFHILYGIVCVFYTSSTLVALREQVDYKYL